MIRRSLAIILLTPTLLIAQSQSEIKKPAILTAPRLAPQNSDSTLRKRLIQRHNAALAEADGRFDEYLTGRGVQEMLLRAIDRIRLSGEELLEPAADHRPFLERCLPLSEAVSTLDTARFDQGRIGMASKLDSDAALLDARIRLMLAAKSSRTPQPPVRELPPTTRTNDTPPLFERLPQLEAGANSDIVRRWQVDRVNILIQAVEQSADEYVVGRGTHETLIEGMLALFDAVEDVSEAAGRLTWRERAVAAFARVLQLDRERLDAGRVSPGDYEHAAAVHAQALASAIRARRQAAGVSTPAFPALTLCISAPFESDWENFTCTARLTRLKQIELPANADELQRAMYARYHALHNRLLGRSSEFTAGRRSMDALEWTTSQLVEALAALHSPTAERILIAEMAMEFVREYDKVNRKCYESGRIAEADWQSSIYYRLDAEIRLLRERARS